MRRVILKLNYKRTFFIGLAFLSISAFWQLYDTIIPLILKNNFFIRDSLIGVIMALDNILALFLLPFFGMLSDRTKSPLGKRTPYILIGTLVSVIFMMIIPNAAYNGNFTLFFVSLGIVLLAMSFYRSPTVALMPDLTQKPLRSKANSVINLMGALGGVLTLIYISVLTPSNENPNYFIVFLAVALTMIISVTVLLVTIRENKLIKEIEVSENELLEEDYEKPASNDELGKDVKKSLYLILASIFLWFMAYNAVTTAFSRYANVVWGMQGGSFANALLVATIAAVLSFIPVGFISTKYGRKKIIMIGIVLMGSSFALAFFFVEFSPIINIIFALTGIGWASINVNSYPMVVEMSKTTDIGKYTGLYYTFSMSAQILTPILSGILIDNLSYRILFPYAVVFSLLSLLTMSKVKHGDSRIIA